MIQRMLLKYTLFGTLLLGTACADFTGPSEAVLDGIEVRLGVEEASLAAHDSLTARLSIYNTGVDTLRLSSGSSCLAVTAVYHHMQRMDLRGTSRGCLAVDRSFVIPPGESLDDHWVLRATTRDGGAPPSGEYLLRLYFNVDGLPDLRHGFEIR